VHNMKRIRWLTAVAILALLSGFLFVKDIFRAPFRSDEALEMLFQVHRSEFEQLRAMAAEDSHVVAYYDKRGLEDSRPKLPTDRVSLYERLIAKTGNVQLVQDRGGALVRFVVARGGSGLAIGPGWREGIEKIASNDSMNEGQVIANLDAAPRMKPGAYLRPVAPGWYLFYDRDEN